MIDLRRYSNEIALPRELIGLNAIEQLRSDIVYVLRELDRNHRIYGDICSVFEGRFQSREDEKLCTDMHKVLFWMMDQCCNEYYHRNNGLLLDDSAAMDRVLLRITEFFVCMFVSWRRIDTRQLPQQMGHWVDVHGDEINRYINLNNDAVRDNDRRDNYRGHPAGYDSNGYRQDRNRDVYDLRDNRARDRYDDCGGRDRYDDRGGRDRYDDRSRGRDRYDDSRYQYDDRRRNHSATQPMDRNTIAEREAVYSRKLAARQQPTQNSYEAERFKPESVDDQRFAHSQPLQSFATPHTNNSAGYSDRSYKIREHAQVASQDRGQPPKGTTPKEHKRSIDEATVQMTHLQQLNEDDRMRVESQLWNDWVRKYCFTQAHIDRIGDLQLVDFSKPGYVYNLPEFSSGDLAIITGKQTTSTTRQAPIRALGETERSDHLIKYTRGVDTDEAPMTQATPIKAPWDIIREKSAPVANVKDIRPRPNPHARLPAFDPKVWYHGWSVVNTEAQLSFTPAVKSLEGNVEGYDKHELRRYAKQAELPIIPMIDVDRIVESVKTESPDPEKMTISKDSVEVTVELLDDVVPLPNALRCDNLVWVDQRVMRFVPDDATLTMLRKCKKFEDWYNTLKLIDDPMLAHRINMDLTGLFNYLLDSCATKGYVGKIDSLRDDYPEFVNYISTTTDTKYTDAALLMAEIEAEFLAKNYHIERMAIPIADTDVEETTTTDSEEEVEVDPMVGYMVGRKALYVSLCGDMLQGQMLLPDMERWYLLSPTHTPEFRELARALMNFRNRHNGVGQVVISDMSGNRVAINDTGVADSQIRVKLLNRSTINTPN